MTMYDYAVIGGSSSIHLSKNISKKLKAKLLKPQITVFPDGECKVTVKAHAKYRKIIVVQSTPPPVDSNILQALSLISKAREMSNEVIAVIPYMGYAKQDKEFLRGEIVTISVIAKLFKAAGATRLVVVDFHSSEALNFFKIPVKNISSVFLLAQYFKHLKLKDPLVVSPDMYWKYKAEEFAKYLHADSIALNKQRNRKTGKLIIKSTSLKFSKGRDLVLVDDMVSTGGSILKSIKFLKKVNFRKIYVACTHPVFVGDSESKIKKSGITKIIGTNSVEGKFAKIDLSCIIVEAILNWES